MSDIDKIFNNINAVGVATAMHGVKKAIPWPGKGTTTLNQFNNLCYNIVTGFVQGETPDNILYSPAGNACQKGMIDQISLSGKSTCSNWIPPPVINPREQVFANAYRKTRNIDESLHICLSKAKNYQETENCQMDAIALRATIGDHKPTQSVENFEVDDTDNKSPHHHHHHPHREQECCNGSGYWFWIILSIFFIFLILIILFTTIRKK